MINRYTRRQFQHEQAVATKIAKIHRTIQGGSIDPAEVVEDPGAAIQALQSPHPEHYLSEEVADLQLQLAQQSEGRASKLVAVAVAQAKVACREAIVGRAVVHRRSAFAHEELADMILELGADAQKGLSTAQLGLAITNYRTAVRMLTVTDGPAEPFSACATRKLCAARKQLLAAVGDGAPEKTAAACDFCGLSAADGHLLRMCGRCRGAEYCCAEHQKADWAAGHKKCCVKYGRGWPNNYEYL